MMENNVNMLLEKVKVAVGKTGEAASRAVDSASQVTRQMAQTTKLSAQLFDVNAELDVQYRQAGKMIYDMRQGVELSQEDLEARFLQIDDLRLRAEELHLQIAENKAGKVCPSCGLISNKECAYCSQCGLSL